MKIYDKNHRNQLDLKLSEIKEHGLSGKIKKGWIKTIREALGMSGTQLSERMGISQQRLSRIEKDELKGVLTLDTMERAAQAMDCSFVYYLIPRTSLNEHLSEQINSYAQTLANRTAHTMHLEKQDISKESLEKLFLEIRNRIAHMPSYRIWDKE